MCVKLSSFVINDYICCVNLKGRDCHWTVWISGLITAYIICCQVNLTLDTILGIEEILISWFLIILVLLDVALLFVCCLIHCKHLRLSDVNKHTYLLTYLYTCTNGQFSPQRRRNRGGNGGARPRNAETAGAKLSFRPGNNLIFCASSRLASRKIYELSHKSWSEWLPGLIAGLKERSPEESKMHQNSWRHCCRALTFASARLSC